MDGGGKAAMCRCWRHRKTVLGPDHPDTLTSMNNLSHTLKKLRRHDEALSMLQACVQLQNQRLGPSHPDTVDCYSHSEKMAKPFRKSFPPRTSFYRPIVHVQSSLHCPWSNQVQKGEASYRDLMSRVVPLPLLL